MPARVITVAVLGVLVLLIGLAVFVVNPNLPIQLRQSEAPYAVLVPDPADVHLVEGDAGAEFTVHTNLPAVSLAVDVDELGGYVGLDYADRRRAWGVCDAQLSPEIPRERLVAADGDKVALVPCTPAAGAPLTLFGDDAPLTAYSIDVPTPTPTPSGIPATPVPDVPVQMTGLTVTALSPAAVALAWDSPDDNGARLVRIEIHRYTTTEAVTYVIDDVELATFTDVDLTPGADYLYRAGAVNALGHGTLSDEVSVTVLALPTPTPTS